MSVWLSMVKVQLAVFVCTSMILKLKENYKINIVGEVNIFF